MSTELTIIKKENIDLIVSNAPAAYEENQLSMNRCLEAGDRLLQQMQQGMTDDLDQQAAVFIEKARKTVRKMNDKRAPLTKLFDDIRQRFTTMENSIDPTKGGTVPSLIQQQRNQYAARKREEEAARQREAMRRQQEQQAKAKYRADCDADYHKSFRETLRFYLDGLRGLFASVTLDNYDQRLADIQQSPTAFPSDYAATVRPAAPLPATGLVTDDELQRIRTEVLRSLLPTFRQEFETAMAGERQHLVDMMPSKRQELQRAAQASAEEAARIKAEMEAREAAQASAEEAARRQQEQQQRIKAEMEAKKAEAGSLFDAAQVAKPAYQPKTAVKKRLVPLNAEAFPEIFSLWWTSEGCRLTVEELSKTFKKQITFCERLAKEGTFIQSEHIYYEDEVKAR